jgi:hypothetical protein
MKQEVHKTLNIDTEVLVKKVLGPSDGDWSINDGGL